MNVPKPLPGSFRDPSGQVYQRNGRIFRTVNESFSHNFAFVRSTGLFQQLADRNLILPFTDVAPDVLQASGLPAACVLEAPTLPFISFPYEWPFSALKAAALLHVRIHLEALKVGVTLSDASAYNIQFQGAEPVFIDHLSFRPYRQGEIWAGHRQFCEQFLNPLLLQALCGIAHNAWYRGSQEGITTEEIRRLLKWRHCCQWNILTHIVLQDFFQKSATADRSVQGPSLSTASFPLASFQRMLQSLADWIERLTPITGGHSPWKHYTATCRYSPAETDRKKRFILKFVQHLQPGLLWDVGCNSGEFSEAALEAGARYVVGFDSDQGALEAGYARAREKGLKFQALFMDAANPSPSQGWNGEERPGLQARASADAVLALALVHHLAIANNVPLVQVMDWLIGLAPHGVIEFIPKNDPMVKTLLQHRDDIFPDYTWEYFCQCLHRRAVIVHTETVSESGRVMVWFRRLAVETA